MNKTRCRFAFALIGFGLCTISTGCHAQADKQAALRARVAAEQARADLEVARAELRQLQSAAEVTAESAAPALPTPAEAAPSSPEVTVAPESRPVEASEPERTATANAPAPGNWPHWRGPEQTGVSREKNLPESWSDEGDNPENLIWRADFGSRSTPLLLNGHVYIINNVGDHPEGGASPTEQERIMCFDAATGKLLWEFKFNLFHTDIPSNRVGWANLAGDPDSGAIYVHGVQGLFFCLSPDGKVLWSKSLTEEFGRISGYGGRTNTPIIDGDLAIISFMSSGWGEHAKSGHRYFAFNKKSGDLVWIAEPGGRPLDTTYSTPVVTVINGQRLLIAGNADGGIYAMKVHTGEKVWGLSLCKRGLNVSPVTDGKFAYIAHSEENLGTNVQGTVICVDATGTGDVTKSHVVWRRDGLTVGYASPVLHDGRLYVVDNAAKLLCLDAKTGETLWQRKIGTVGKGSPVWADGKIYCTETNGRFWILKPGESDCEVLDQKKFESKIEGVNLEAYGTPAVGNGRVYFSTAEQTFCIGKKDWKSAVDPIPPQPSEGAVDRGATATWLQVVPAEVLAKPDDKVKFTARLFDAKGRYLKDVENAEWSVKMLKGKVSDGAVLSIASDAGLSGGTVTAKVGELTGVARVRVASPYPYGEDFEKVEEKKTPSGWVACPPVKFAVESLDGNKVLKKLADNPQFARADTFFGPAESSNYTIEVDVMGKEEESQIPDIGVTANRYTFELLGVNQRARIVTWRPMPRLDAGIDYPWKKDTWYRLKLTTAEQGGKFVVRGKVWPRDEAEPDKWTVEVTDEVPNREGSPGVYAFTNILRQKGPEAYFDNIKVTPNAK